MGMKDNDLITRREVELVLLEKGQRSRRYSLGDLWELNFDEIREALSEYQPKIVRCKDCKYCVKEPNGELYCDILAVGYEPLGSKKVNGECFCADGERKD